jgi:hypothetical protein
MIAAAPSLGVDSDQRSAAPHPLRVDERPARRSAKMQTGDIFYLSMVIVLFIVFAAVLAWVSRNWKA